jgi:hypothetical protein
VKTTLEIDDRLLERAKRAAREPGVTLRAVVEDALSARLTGGATRRPSYQFDAPIARGTAAPAVDPADRRALYDYLDVRE